MATARQFAREIASLEGRIRLRATPLGTELREAAAAAAGPSPGSTAKARRAAAEPPRAVDSCLGGASTPLPENASRFAIIQGAHDDPCYHV